MKTIPLTFLFLALLALDGQAQYNVPEVLEYDLSWNGIHAGSSELAIRPAMEDILITSTADSAKFISLFYKVNDRVEALCRKDTLYPIRYRIDIREGANRRDKEVLFQKDGLAGGKAFYTDYGHHEKTECNLPPEGVYDPLSALYYVRGLPLKVGMSVFLKIFDGGKIWNTEVKVLRRQKVKTWLGSFNTILIRPVLRSEGIFFREGEIYIWLTDDARRIPVMLQTAVAVGHIKAILKAIR